MCSITVLNSAMCTRDFSQTLNIHMGVICLEVMAIKKREGMGSLKQEMYREENKIKLEHLESSNETG